MVKTDPQYIEQVLTLLKKQYPKAKIILNYSNTWELLVAVILSAQCTDKMVNIVTAKLFKKYTTIEDYANADILELEQDIHSTGFYRNKAKNVKAAAKLILNNFGGQVPKTMEELVMLPGVARKTANVVLGNAYTIYNGIAVDTHVFRVSKRLGFAKGNNPEKVEQELMQSVPKKWWFPMTYLLIEHGRAVCKAPLPKCDQCFLNKICPSAFQFPNFQKV
jgi:endonuclease III